MSLTVMGIDPGYVDMGLAIIERTPTGWRVVHTMTSRTNASQIRSERMAIHCANLITMADEWRPELICCEDVQGVFHGAQQHTGKTSAAVLNLLRVEGAAECVAARIGVPFVSVRPQTWRAHFGLGKATDAQIRQMVERIAGKINGSFHAVEAAAIGICGAARWRAAA